MLQNSLISSTSHDNGEESKLNRQLSDLNANKTSPKITINANKRQICTEEDVGYQYKIGSPKLPKLCDISNQTRYVLYSDKIDSATSLMVDPIQQIPRRKLYSVECIDGCVSSRAKETTNNNVDKLDKPALNSESETSTTYFTTEIIGDIDRDTPALSEDYQEPFDFIKLLNRIQQKQQEQLQQTTQNDCGNDPIMMPGVSSAVSISPSIEIDSDSQSIENGSSMQLMEPYHDRNYQEARYKTELCLHFRERNSCPHGNRCLFAHGLEELRPYRGRHPKHKTQNCKAFHEEGYCNYGYRCSYIHSESPRTIAYIKKLNRKAQAIKRSRIYKMNKQLKKNDHQPTIYNNDDDHSNDENREFRNPRVIYRTETSNNYNNYNTNDNINDQFQQTNSLRWRNYLQERQNQHQRNHYQS